MPIFEFHCGSGHRYEDIFFPRDPIPDALPCPRKGCELPSMRQRVNKFRHVGPVFEDMDRYEGALLSPKQRTDTDKNNGRGARFRGPKDVSRMEQDLGLSRVDPNSASERHKRDEQRDEIATRARVNQESGLDGELDWIERQNITEASGMTDMEYVRWKGMSDAAESAAIAGTVDLSGGTVTGSDA